MTPVETHIHPLDLEAYADGRLDRDPARKEAVEAYLDGRPEERERIRAYRTIANRIRVEYQSVLDEPVPARLTEALARDGNPPAHRTLRRLALAASLVLAAGIGGWTAGHFGLFGAGTDGPDVRAIVAAHHDAMISGAAEVADAARTSRGPAMTGEPQLAMPAPDLSELGYRLERTAAYEDDSAKRTLLFYRDGDGDAITLVLERPILTAQGAPVVKESGGVQNAYWTDSGLTVVVVGERVERILPTVQAAVDRALQRLDGADPATQPLGAPLMAGDQPSAAGEPAPDTLAPADEPLIQVQ